jgi:hypothetical protein
MMTRYVRYEEISFVCPSGAGYQDEAAMMRRARTDVENESLRSHERVESVDGWASETHSPQSHRSRPGNLGTRHMTRYWYRITITGAQSSR